MYNIGTHDRLQGAAPGATWVSSSPGRKGCDGGCGAAAAAAPPLLGAGAGVPVAAAAASAVADAAAVAVEECSRRDMFLVDSYITGVQRLLLDGVRYPVNKTRGTSNSAVYYQKEKP